MDVALEGTCVGVCLSVCVCVSLVYTNCHWKVAALFPNGSCSVVLCFRFIGRKKYNANFLCFIVLFLCELKCHNSTLEPGLPPNKVQLSCNKWQMVDFYILYNDAFVVSL